MPTQNIFDLVDTWNNAATTFTAIKMAVTDTASNASSLLMDLQVGGSSKFSVAKSGTVVAGRPGSANSFYYATAIGSNFTGWAEADANTAKFIVNSTGVSAGMLQVRFASSDYGISVGKSLGIGASDASSADVWLSRRAAANLRLGAADAAAPVAQTLSVQSVVAGTTNTAGANLTITGSQGTGTGAGGSIIFQVAPAGSSGTAQNALATALTIAASKVITVADTYDLAFSTSTGTKIGTATTQKLAFYNATPVVQPTAVADATDAASVITQLNALLSRMRNLGLIAT